MTMTTVTITATTPTGMHLAVDADVEALPAVLAALGSTQTPAAPSEDSDIAMTAATEKETLRIDAREAATNRALEADIRRQTDRLVGWLRDAGSEGIDPEVMAKTIHAATNSRNRATVGGASSREVCYDALRALKAEGTVVLAGVMTRRYYLDEFAPQPLPSFATKTAAEYVEGESDDAGDEYELAEGA